MQKYFLLEQAEWRAQGGGTADMEVAVLREHHPAPLRCRKNTNHSVPLCRGERKETIGWEHNEREREEIISFLYKKLKMKDEWKMSKEGVERWVKNEISLLRWRWRESERWNMWRNVLPMLLYQYKIVEYYHNPREYETWHCKK